MAAEVDSDQGYREEGELGSVVIELERVYVVEVMGLVGVRSIVASWQVKVYAAVATELEKVCSGEVMDLDEVRSIVVSELVNLPAVEATELEEVSSIVVGDLVVEQSTEVEVEAVAIAEWHRTDLVRENEDHELGLVRLEEGYNIGDPVANTEQEEEEVLDSPLHGNLFAGSNTQLGAGTVAEKPIGVWRCPRAHPWQPPPSDGLYSGDSCCRSPRLR